MKCEGIHHWKKHQTNTGTPLIGRFFGPRKNRLNRKPFIGGVCMI